MPILVLEVMAGEHILANGVLMRLRNKTRVEVTAPARILAGKQVMRLQDATTHLRRVYYAAQQAYAGPEADRNANWHQMHVNAASWERDCTTSAADREAMQRALDLAGTGDGYEALKLIRHLIREEERAERGADEAAEEARAIDELAGLGG